MAIKIGGGVKKGEVAVVMVAAEVEAVSAKKRGRFRKASFRFFWKDIVRAV